MKYKDFPGAILPAAGLGARQVRAIASDASVDRDNDVLDPAGCDLSGYAGIVLACHDQTEPVGKAAITRTRTAIEALITFARLGASRKADEFCALCKDGVLTGVSVGFRPTEPPQPRGGGRGYLFKAWELLEISLVAVPSNPNAVVLERAYAKDGRVLAGAHVDSLMRGHRRIRAGLQDVADVLKAGGADPDEDDEDYELAFGAGRGKRAWMRGRGDPEAERRKRMLAVAKMRWPPASSADGGRAARMRLVQIAKVRLGPDTFTPSDRAARMRLVERLRRGP
jgi:HK97 family phage prohead protease